MRRVLHSPKYALSSLCAAACKASPLLPPGPGVFSAGCPTALHVSARLQGTFGGGRRGGGRGGRSEGRGNGNGAGAQGAATRRVIINKTGDGELSDLTRSMMRDDSKILTSIVKHIPPNGAISVKSLNAQLSPDVQEAIAEKYDGLKSFLEQRKQLFVVKANPVDGVLYAAATPVAYQKLLAREKQRETMQEMLGLNRRGGFRGRGGGGGRGGRGGRGGGGGRGGFRGGGGGRGGGGRGGGDRGYEQNNRGGGGGFRGRGNGGRMGGEGRSFGTRSHR